MITEQVLLTLNKPNKNNRVYTTENVQLAIDKINDTLPGFLGSSYDFDLAKIEFTVSNIRIEENNVIGDVVFRQPSMENIIYDQSASVGFRMSCIAEVNNKNGVHYIENITFTSVNLVANHT